MLPEWITIRDRDKCKLPAWQRVLVSGRGIRRFYLYDAIAIQPLLRLSGPNMWRGYDNVGNEFGAATDAAHWFALQFRMNASGASVAMIRFTQNEHGVFMMWFASMEAFADKNGAHYGIHPCAVIEAPRNYIEQWLEATQA